MNVRHIGGTLRRKEPWETTGRGGEMSGGGRLPARYRLPGLHNEMIAVMVPDKCSLSLLPLRRDTLVCLLSGKKRLMACSVGFG